MEHGSGQAKTIPISLKSLGWGAYAEQGKTTVDVQIVDGPTRPGRNQLCIRTWTGTAITLNGIDPSNTIADVKRMIQGAGGISPEQQHLRFNLDRLYYDHKTLAECKVFNESTFHLELHSRYRRFAVFRTLDNERICSVMIDNGENVARMLKALKVVTKLSKFDARFVALGRLLTFNLLKVK